MRRPLAMVLAALFGAALVVVIGNTPASAVNVRYQASKSCTVDGKKFSAHILTYGRPTPANGAYTEVQLWGYKYERGMEATYVEARTVVWIDNSWHDAGSGPGYEGDPPADGEWHRGDNVGPEWIGYITPTRPKAILVRGYTKGEFAHEHFCYVVLRPYDLEWIG